MVLIRVDSIKLKKNMLKKKLKKLINLQLNYLTHDNNIVKYIFIHINKIIIIDNYTQEWISTYINSPKRRRLSY